MRRIFTSIFCLFLFSSQVFAEDVEEGETGLKLPRMVSLRSNHINARSGPGARYPIEWVYMQKGAPVEITAEFELWRKIKDWEGSESWVHKSMLMSARGIKVITPGENNLYAKPDTGSQVVAKVEDQAIGMVKKCPANMDFCQIKFPSAEGWLPRSNLFGIYPKEEIE